VKIKKIGTVVGALAVLGTGATIASSSAGATSTTVTASTLVSNHPDTTSGGSGTACTSSPGGPVWAIDAYASQMTAVTTGTNTWRVTIQDVGSFAGFADPATCNAMTSKGSLLGLYTVSVTSANTPSQANLKSSYSGAVTTTQMVQDFFNDHTANNVAGGAYFFDYENGAYVQTGPDTAPGSSGGSVIYGDVTPYTAPPPVMVRIPSVAGLSASAALTKIRALGFSAYTSPFRNPAYTYVATGTSPAAGSLAPKGSTVIVFVKQT
jgi:hypothetical protein